MCDSLKQDMCSVTNTRCPYVYFCSKTMAWKPNKYMPQDCKVKKQIEVPEGCYYVRDARKGYLYVDIDNQTYKLLNPFDFVPTYVKISKTKNGYKIRKQGAK